MLMPFSHAVEASVYGRRFTRYLLIKVDWLYQDHAQQMTFNFLSAEHVLPQIRLTIANGRRDFTDEQRNEWTDRLGNLVLNQHGEE